MVAQATTGGTLKTSMHRGFRGHVSPFASLLLGALGAFIFFGILSGIIPRADTTLQVAQPLPALEEVAP